MTLYKPDAHCESCQAHSSKLLNGERIDVAFLREQSLDLVDRRDISISLLQVAMGRPLIM